MNLNVYTRVKQQSSVLAGEPTLAPTIAALSLYCTCTCIYMAKELTMPQSWPV